MSDKEPVVLTAQMCSEIAIDNSTESGLAAYWAVRAIEDGQTTVIPTAELARLRTELIDAKVDRAKLDNEAYQRGYANALKHAELEAAEPVAWANWLELNMANIDADERTMTVGNCEMVPFDTPLYLGPRRMTEAQAAESFEKANADLVFVEDRDRKIAQRFWLAALRHVGAIKDPT